MYIRIECEFTSNKTRGSRMNNKLNVFFNIMLWLRVDALKESISTLKCLSEIII